MLTEFTPWAKCWGHGDGQDTVLVPKDLTVHWRLTQMISTPPFRKQHTTEGHSPVLGGVGSPFAGADCGRVQEGHPGVGERRNNGGKHTGCAGGQVNGQVCWRWGQ